MRLSVALGIALIWSGAQAQMKIPAVQLAKPPVIDGVVSDGEWDGASHVTGFIDPNTEKPAEDQTEVWLAYDSEAVYVAFKLHDSQPDKIVATSTQPGTLGNEDMAELYVDPFNKKEWDSTNYFRCNSRGVQDEYLAGGRSAKKEWRGSWQCKTSINNSGWVAEMRIPWKIMNLPVKGKRTASVVFRRFQLRSMLSSSVPNLGTQMWFNRSAEWHDIEIPESKVNPLSYQAYLSPSASRGRFDAASGLDVRYRLTPQLTALASFNPDFENVEQSVSSIEFSRAERYLDDSRPFFNEGNSFIDVYDSYGSAFYSRRIADFDFGAKAYGNIGSKHELGAFATQTGDSETNAMFRYAYKFTPTSSATFYGTSHDAEGLQNRLYGTRLLYGKGSWMGLLTSALSDDDGLTNSAGSARVSYSSTKWSGGAVYSWVEPGFNPAIGYCSFDNERGAAASVEYTEMYSKGYLRMFDSWLSAQSFEHYDGSNQTRSFSPSVSFQTKNNIYLQLSATLEDFEAEAERTATCKMSFFDTKYTDQLTLGATAGTRAGRNTSYYSARIRRRIAPNVDVGLTYARQEYLGITEQTVFTVGWIIDPKRTLTARTVYRQGKTNAFLAFKSAGFTGMDWYLIVGDPNAQEWKDRIVVKLVWAW